MRVFSIAFVVFFMGCDDSCENKNDLIEAIVNGGGVPYEYRYDYDIYKECKGFSPLWYAAKKKEKNMAEKLLDGGWPIGEKKIGESSSSPEIAWFFYTNGWRDLIPDEFDLQKRWNGEGLYLHSCEYGGLASIADSMAMFSKNDIGDDGGNCFHRLAAARNSTKTLEDGVVPYLLGEGVQLNQIDHFGNTALGRAVNFHSFYKKDSLKEYLLKFSELLLENGASPNVSATDLTPLEFAIIEGDSDMVQLLRKYQGKEK